MSGHSCPRLFEAEALRDGRLGDGERPAFERHLAVCPDCSREAEALETLAQALRASAPAHADRVRVHRERIRLLGAFDRELLASVRPSATRGRLLWPAAIAAVLVGALVVQRGRRVGEALQPVASRAVIHADGTTAWSERTDGDREVVVLAHGSLRIHVDRAARAHRLVVVLPDGELEDTGTTFTVSAENGRTTLVSVQEGSVALRLRGKAPLGIEAGNTWTPAVPPVPASAHASSAPSNEPVPIAPSPSPLVNGKQEGAVTATTPGPVRDPSLDFRAAMAALDRGDNREAAFGFARFLATHPRDPRTEDAMYLRVIALQRCGDRGGTRTSALDYLRHYPHGFRHVEMEALSR